MSKTPRRYQLAELSERFGLELRGDGAHEVSGVGTLAAAGPDQVSFLANRAYRKLLPATTAGVVILKRKDADQCPVNCLLSDNPYASYARIANLFDARPAMEAGVHASAVIDPGAEVGEGVAVGPNAVIGADCVIGRNCSIGPGCVIGTGSKIGDNSRLAANVTLADGITIGRRVIIHSGAVIGADGFGIAFDGDHWVKVPQLGGVVIGDDCEIGANSAIDRGAIEDTVLEEDVRLDNLVQVGHAAFLGAHTAIAGCSGIAGSARIGRNCLIAGGVGVFGHIEIADGVTIGAQTIVAKSITEANSTWGSGIPARPFRDWQRSLGQLNMLGRKAARRRAPEQESGDKLENE